MCFTTLPQNPNCSSVWKDLSQNSFLLFFSLPCSSQCIASKKLPDWVWLFRLLYLVLTHSSLHASEFLGVWPRCLVAQITHEFFNFFNFLSSKIVRSVLRTDFEDVSFVTMFFAIFNKLFIESKFAFCAFRTIQRQVLWQCWAIFILYPTQYIQYEKSLVASWSFMYFLFAFKGWLITLHLLAPILFSTISSILTTVNNSRVGLFRICLSCQYWC